MIGIIVIEVLESGIMMVIEGNLGVSACFWLLCSVLRSCGCVKLAFSIITYFILFLIAHVLLCFVNPMA